MDIKITTIFNVIRDLFLIRQRARLLLYDAVILRFQFSATVFSSTTFLPKEKKVKGWLGMIGVGVSREEAKVGGWDFPSVRVSRHGHDAMRATNHT